MRILDVRHVLRALSILLAVAFLGCLSWQPALALTGTTPSGPKVSFTFDDGPTSDLLAAQTLQPYGYHATAYIITGCVGMTTAPNTCAADGSVTYMTWNDIATLHTTYGWEIGSHTITHPLTAAADNPSLTDQQLDTEMSGSQAALAAHGYTATDFASPYGDYDNRSLAVIAKYYNSHRAFQDLTYPPDSGEIVNTFPYYAPRSTYPYNNYLLTVLPVQGNVPVATVESYIDQAKANNQWLILVFHHIVSGTASTNVSDYQYSATDLGSVASYVHNQNIPVVPVNDGLAGGTNIMPNSSFTNGIANGWTTDDPTNIVADQQTTSLAGHGSYDGTPQGPLDSVHLSGNAAKDTHLFSPKVTVIPGTTYTLTNFVNLTSTSGEIDFYVDEYNASGTWVSGKYVQGITGSTNKNAVQVGDINFTYTPSSSSVASADLQVIAHGAGTQAYVDNLRWLSPTPPDTTSPVISSVGASNLSTAGATVNWTTDEASSSQVNYGTTAAYGSSSSLATALTTTHNIALTGLQPNTTYHYQVVSADAAGNTAKSSDFTFTTAALLVPGDVNGDGVVNILDLSIVLTNWGKTGATRSQGDVTGDGVVNVFDLSAVLTDWS